jgi:endonuclease/exonuclease/phosphatase family metal-dependent hydrolase
VDLLALQEVDRPGGHRPGRLLAHRCGLRSPVEQQGHNIRQLRQLQELAVARPAPRLLLGDLNDKV